MKKLLVIGVIALFVGVGIQPAISNEVTTPAISDDKEDWIECQSNGSLCTLYLFLRTRGYFVLLRLEYYAAVLYVMGLYDLLDIFVDYIIYPQYEKLWYYEEKLVEYDCGVPPLPI